MPPLPCDTMQTDNGFSIHYQSSAHTSAHDHTEDYFCLRELFLHNTELGFRQGKTIRIVGHLYFYTEQLLKVFLHRLAVHGCGIAILHGTQPRIMNTWCTDPYPGRFYTGLFL